MKNIKKILTSAFVIGALSVFAACGGSNNNDGDGDFNANRQIAVVTRESGSGTRGAFVEIIGLEVDGNDSTYIGAEVQNGTGAVLGTVSNEIYSIGYVTLGSMRDDVRALSINGIAPTAENIQNGSYTLFRPFYIVIGRDAEENALRDDFKNFILSAEGQGVVASGYIPISGSLPSWQPSGLTGNLDVAGSTSVFPLMSRLAEAYEAANPGVTIDIQSVGSTGGITQGTDGTVHIGMSSRDLRPSEMELAYHWDIAYDGLVIIVNPDNPLQNLALEDVREIFLGNERNWSAFIN
ncbi:MAG: substrate-binding domain-containing protein [Defluviitaleaceae bacterium]|nr:substrate-binding domain-containing protein [Defluviitaleaceae bacterium]